MSNLTTCQLKIQFEFGLIDGRHMQTTVINNNNTYLITPDNNSCGMIEFCIDLPTQIVLNFTGKNPNTDTLVDENGNIVGDMYVKIVSIAMDGFELKEIFLHQRMKLLTNNGQEIVTSYVGFNGSIVIDMPESDIFSQYHLLNL